MSKHPYQVDKAPIGILPFHDHHLVRTYHQTFGLEVLCLEIMAPMFGDGCE